MVECGILIQQMSSVGKSFRDERSRYIDNHRTFDRDKDARITLLSKCIVAIHSAWVELSI